MAGGYKDVGGSKMTRGDNHVVGLWRWDAAAHHRGARGTGGVDEAELLCQSLSDERVDVHIDTGLCEGFDKCDHLGSERVARRAGCVLGSVRKLCDGLEVGAVETFGVDFGRGGGVELG